MPPTGDNLDADDLDDRDLPDPSDMDKDDYTVMSRCPYCKKMIDEQSEICPRCGSFINLEDAPRTKPAWWVIILIVLLGLMMIWTVLR